MTPEKPASTPRSLPRLAALLAVILLFILFRILTFGNSDLNGFDENYYLHFAKILSEQGLDGIRQLLYQFGSSPDLSMAPLPLRFVYIGAGAVVCSISGTFDPQHMAVVSLLASIVVGVTAAIVFPKAVKAPGMRGALLALLAFSPLQIHLSNRALQDSLMAMFMLVAIAVFHAIWTRPRINPWLPPLFGTMIYLGFLTKESMLFLYPSFLLVGIVYAWQPQANDRLTLRVRASFLPAFIAPFLYFLTAAYISGGIDRFFEIYLSYSRMQELIPYALHFQKGEWFRYLVDFMLMSPIPFFLAIIGIGQAWLSPERNASLWMKISAVYLMAGLVTFGFLPILNIRLVLYLDVFVRILALATLVDLSATLSAGAPSRKAAVLAVLLITTCLFDAYQYWNIFVWQELYDPVTFQLIKTNGFFNPDIVPQP